MSGSGIYEFSPDGISCRITTAETPMPWLNLLANDSFQTWITNKGYTECYQENRNLNGLTNPQEVSGLMYLRDDASGESFLFNEPAAGEPFLTVHGLGWTAIERTALDIECQATYFVPRDDNLLVWVVRVANRGPAPRQLSLFSAVEWSLGDEFKFQVLRGHGGGGPALTGGSQFNLYKKIVFEDGMLLGTADCWKTLGITQERWPYTGFFASVPEPVGFDTVKSLFVGDGGSVRDPVAVRDGRCSNTPVWGENYFPWGVLHHRLEVTAGGEAWIILLLGMVKSREAARALQRKYAGPGVVDAELARVKEFWSRFVSTTTTVETPEREIDGMVNVWNKYQWRTDMVRNPSTGLRGLGFWSYGIGGGWGGLGHEVETQPHDLAIVRESILSAMQEKYRDLAARLASVHRAIPHHHETVIIPDVADYVKESGDWGLLDEVVPLADGGADTVFNVLANEIRYALLALGPRGLPRIPCGVGDWNDELNFLSREGKAESVMMAGEYCSYLRESSELARRHGRSREADDWLAMYRSIKEAVNYLAWDGRWYIRAFSDGQPELAPMGSSRNEEGKIHLNAQSWAVLSGIAEGERLRSCMDSVESLLMSEYGPLQSTPPYTHFDPHIGTLTKYAPGWRQSCVYLRPTGWAVMAACVAGRAELAWRMYRSASITNLRKDTRRFECEPYVYPEVYVGTGHRLAGRGQYQWNLGEGANWMWRSFVYYILGIRPTFDGLLADPQIPKEWKGFRMRRTFRGAQYEIEVRNPKGLTSGVRSFEVDGARMEGNVIPAFADGRRHAVSITLGI